jgi:hypothetical protein
LTKTGGFACFSADFSGFWGYSGLVVFAAFGDASIVFPRAAIALLQVNEKAQSPAGKVGVATVARGAQHFGGVEFYKFCGGRGL